VKRAGSTNVVFFLVIVFMSLAFGWIYVAEIDEVIRAPGVVEPEGQVQKVQSRSPGKIATMSVKVGDTVSKGQILITLDNEEAEASLAKNQIALNNLRAETARLEAEILLAKSINWDTTISEKTKEIQTRLFESRMITLKQQRAVLNEELSNQKNNFIELKQTIKGKESLLTLKTKEREIYKPLVDQGIEPLIRLVNIDQAIQEINNQIANSRIQLDGIKIEIQTLLERDKELIASHKSAAFDALAPKSLEFEMTTSETLALQKRLADSKLKSPIDGIVTKVYPSGAGEIVNTGADLVEIVPISDEITVLAKLPTKDVTSIQVGQNTRIALDSYDFTVFGTIDSYVDKIAQNTTTAENGDVFYEVWLKTRSLKFSKSDKKPQMLPGMLAQVEITGKKRTVLEYLMKPVLETTSKALTEK